MIKKKTYSNTLFLSKSVADIVIGATSMPFLTVYTNNGMWPLGYGLCVIWVVLDYSCCSISIFNLLLITWHRYTQLKYPFKSTEDLTILRYVIIVFVWIIPTTFWLASVIPITSKNLKADDCAFTYSFIYVMLANSFLYIIPLVVLLMLNVLTYRELKIKSRRITALGVIDVTNTMTVNTVIHVNDDTLMTSQGIVKETKKHVSTSKTKLSKDLKAVTCLIVVSLILVFCWSLFIIVWPLRAACSNCISNVLFEVSYWLPYSSSTLYPISLFIFHEAIKRSFLGILKTKQKNDR